MFLAFPPVRLGDIKPGSVEAKFVAMVMICFSFVVVPMEPNTLIRTIAAKSSYALTKYKRLPGTVSIVVW